MNKIIIAGIGPGSSEDITPAVAEVLKSADAVVGYKPYFEYVDSLLPETCMRIDTGMKQETDRAKKAFELAKEGKTVVVISSGDAGIYGMAPLIWEMSREADEKIDITVLPGISAFQKAASLLGAPMGHDFCVISLSDLYDPLEPD